MAWTATRTYAPGEIFTAAWANAYLRDNLDYLKDQSRLENGGADEMTVAGLSGLLADDQHVLDAEVTAVALALAGGTMVGTILTTVDAGLRRNSEDEQVNVEGGITHPGKFIAYGKDHGATPGAIGALVPDAAKTADVWAFRFSGATDTPEMTVGSIPNARLSWQKFVRKAADETVNNSVVVQNDDHLVFAVLANEIWEFILHLRTQSPTATPDIDYAFTIPAAATLIMGELWNRGGVIEIEFDGTIQSQLEVDNNIRATRIYYLYIGAGNAGNVQLQWAQAVATVEDTKVLENSFIIARRLS